MKYNKKNIFRVSGLILLLCLVIALAAYDQFMRDATAGFENAKSVHVYPESSLETVADSMSSKGILAKKRGFVWFGILSGWGSQIKAGHYKIEPGASNREILDRLRKGLQAPVRVRVPAGSQKNRLIERMAETMAFSDQDLADAFRDGDLAMEMGTDTTHLWAYMVPDTYFFYWLSRPEDVIRRIKERFDNILAAAYDSLEALPMNLNADEVIRLAGIVEWESAYLPEKPTIAGVYLNRLRNGWALQADPTVQYAIMSLEGEKRRLLFNDYDLDHPYNTYNYRGLPPGPITNPSLTSIQGVLYPVDHRYFYFVAKGDGQHIFSRTLSEHRRNARAYYRLMRERQSD